MRNAFGTPRGDHSRSHALRLVRRVVRLRGLSGATADAKVGFRRKLDRTRAEQTARRLRNSRTTRRHTGAPRG
jgi:hypothetical protein